MKRIYDAIKGDRHYEVFLNGKKLIGVYRCRVGSSGWVDQYIQPIKATRHYLIKRLPRMRGKVMVVATEPTGK